MSDGDDGSESVDIEVLRSACVESRAVLDDQLDELSDIGDKAIWTVRSSVLVLGLVVSAASLGDGRTIRHLYWTVKLLVGSGTAALLSACVYGLGTYFGMERINGIGSIHRRQARHARVDERNWRRALLRGYDEWIAEMDSMTDRYGTHLFRTQAVFVLGVILFVLGGILSVSTL